MLRTREGLYVRSEFRVFERFVPVRLSLPVWEFSIRHALAFPFSKLLFFFFPAAAVASKFFLLFSQRRGANRTKDE